MRARLAQCLIVLLPLPLHNKFAEVGAEEEEEEPAPSKKDKKKKDKKVGWPLFCQQFIGWAACLQWCSAGPPMPKPKSLASHSPV